MGGHYRSAANRDLLDRRGLKPEFQRAKPRRRPMPRHVARGNARRARVRAKVEHVFAVQKHRFELVIRTVGLARARQSWRWRTSPTTSPGSPGSTGDLPPHDAAGRKAAADRRPSTRNRYPDPDRRADTAQPANRTPQTRRNEWQDAVRLRSVTVQIGRAMTFRQRIQQPGNQPTDDGGVFRDRRSRHGLGDEVPQLSESEVPQLSESEVARKPGCS